MMYFTNFYCLIEVIHIIKTEEVVGQNPEEHHNLFQQDRSHNHLRVFLYKKNFYKKMSLKNRKTLRKC